MIINESTAYKKDYRKIIINKHMVKEQEKINNIKNIILISRNFHELLCSPYKDIYYITKKSGNLKEYYTARINSKLRLIMKALGDYPYDNLLIDKIEFVSIDDKHYGEG